jgi:hypothetical protein
MINMPIAGALLLKRDERLVFVRIVPSLEGIHTGEFGDRHQFGLPVPSLRKLMGVALRQRPTAVLGNHRPHHREIFLERRRIRDDVFDHQVGFLHERTP